MALKLIIRGFTKGCLLFADRLEVNDQDIEDVIPWLVEKRWQILVDHPRHWIEIEFLDEPDPAQRFFRFGTDPNGMVMPIEIDLKDIKGQPPPKRSQIASGAASKDIP